MEPLEILAIVAALIGLAGSIIPGIPGPPISWLGILFCFIAKCARNGVEMSLTFLMVWLGITIVVTILDYVVPAWFTRVTGGQKSAAVGAIVGLFAGLIIPPIGMIVGSLLGAFLADLFVEDKGVWNAFKASIGAFLGFICGTGMKLICSGIMAYYIFVYVF